MRRTRVVLPLLLLATTAGTGIAATGRAAAADPLVDATHPLALAYTAPTAGEGLLDLTVGSPGADWSAATAQGAVLEVDVDGVKATDLDVPTEAPVARRVQLGTLAAGPHTVSVQLSPSSPRPTASVTGVGVSLGTDPALAYAPVVYGRTLAAYGSPTQSATDDAPLIGWHETSTPQAGQTRHDFSMIWTNEDNGTGSPDLMGRWGRTTDIELSYSVVLTTATGAVVSETIQGPNHVTRTFNGRHEGTHPLLAVCTGNNNFCDDSTPPEGSATPVAVGAPLRYLLAYDETRAPGRARETLMDAHPWVYPVMAAEQQREGKVSTAVCVPAASDTVHVCDQRRYLFMEVVKTTGFPKDPTGSYQPIGVSLAVTLRDGTTYTTDRGVTGRTAVRDVPVTESAELPAGTTPADVVRISAVRQNSATTPDPLSVVTVSALSKAFFLGADYLPRASFLSDGTTLPAGPVTLTPLAPSAVIWQRTAADPAPALPEAGAPVVLVLLGLGGALVVRRSRGRVGAGQPSE